MNLKKILDAFRIQDAITVWASDEQDAINKFRLRGIEVDEVYNTGKLDKNGNQLYEVADGCKIKDAEDKPKLSDGWKSKCLKAFKDEWQESRRAIRFSYPDFPDGISWQELGDTITSIINDYLRPKGKYVSLDVWGGPKNLVEVFIHDLKK